MQVNAIIAIQSKIGCFSKVCGCMTILPSLILYKEFNEKKRYLSYTNKHCKSSDLHVKDSYAIQVSKTFAEATNFTLAVIHPHILYMLANLHCPISSLHKKHSEETICGEYRVAGERYVHMCTCLETLKFRTLLKVTIMQQ